MSKQAPGIKDIAKYNLAEDREWAIIVLICSISSIIIFGLVFNKKR
jgi:hypothetical protein